jgi:hypothetical protein
MTNITVMLAVGRTFDLSERVVARIEADLPGGTMLAVVRVTVVEAAIHILAGGARRG